MEERDRALQSLMQQRAIEDDLAQNGEATMIAMHGGCRPAQGSAGGRGGGLGRGGAPGCASGALAMPEWRHEAALVERVTPRERTSVGLNFVR